MTHHVVDENVLVVANNRDTHAGPNCILNCVNFLEKCSQDESIVLDSEYLIRNRYANHCNWSGEPGVGDQFFIWVHENAARLRQVAVPTTEGEFDHFPRDERLTNFDHDDRIYVAVTLAAGDDVLLVNAVDSDYSIDAVPLQHAGVEIRELCREELKPSRFDSEGRESA